MQRASIQAPPVRRSAAPKSRAEQLWRSEDAQGRPAGAGDPPKGNVKAQLLGARPDLPQTEHRVASPTNPEEGNPPLPKHLCEF
jgi:hypothetical protein